MKICQYDALDEPAMVAVAVQFASYLTVPLVLTFQGEIGAGKTTFIRALLRALGVKGAIKSPTFSLVESYQLGSSRSTRDKLQQSQKSSREEYLHHFDLYRIHDEHELEYLGFRDYFSDNAICCIEWPERTSFCLGMADIQYSFQSAGDAGDRRRLDVTALTAKGEGVLACIMGS